MTDTDHAVDKTVDELVIDLELVQPGDDMRPIVERHVRGLVARVTGVQFSVPVKAVKIERLGRG